MKRKRPETVEQYYQRMVKLRTDAMRRLLGDDIAQADRALRDLMPVVEWLTNADAAQGDGASDLAMCHLLQAFIAFKSISADSPAVEAYIRWLEQNTEAAGWP